MSPESSPKYPRRRYLIDRQFQLSHTVVLALAVFLLSSTFGVFLYSQITNLTELSIVGHPETTALLTEHMAPYRARLMVEIVLLSTLSSMAVAVLGIILTHRIAGPTLVINRYLESLASGQPLPKMRNLRKNDALTSIHLNLKAAINQISLRTQKEIETLETLKTQLHTHTVDPALVQALETHIGELKQYVQQSSR